MSRTNKHRKIRNRDFRDYTPKCGNCERVCIFNIQSNSWECPTQGKCRTASAREKNH